MNYRVLARKYRPSVFSEVVGQQHALKILRNSLKADRLHHAFVFSGSRGVGKTTIARILAKAVNCLDDASVEPCGRCANCLAISEGALADVVEIDGASNTGVDHVRSLREQVRYLPVAGKRKVYIIDEVHMLSSAAFNALLKTLEEPPDHVLFIFATTEVHKIPVTILSRCQRIEFRDLPPSDLVEHFRAILQAEGIESEPEVLVEVAREARGSVRDGLSLLDQAISHGDGQLSLADLRDALGLVDRALAEQALVALVRRQPSAIVESVQEVASRGYDLAEFAEILLSGLRDLRVMQVGKRLEVLSLGSAEKLEALANETDAAQLHRLFDLVMRTCEDIKLSETPLLSLEMGLLRATLAVPALSIEAALKQLSEARVDAHASPPPPPKQDSPASPVVERTSTASGAPPVRSGAEVPSAPIRVPAAEVQAHQMDDLSAKPTMPRERWEAAVRFLRTKKPGLGALLEHASPLGFEGENLLLGFPKGSFYVETARDKETQKDAEAALSTFLGRRTALVIKELSQEQRGETLAEARDEEAERQRELKVQAAEAESSVQGAMKVLGAKLTNIELAKGQHD